MSVITETIFDSRFKQAEELGRWAPEFVTRKNCYNKGVPMLSGAKVEATDSVGRVSCVSRTCCRGQNGGWRIHNVDRGYEV